VRALAGLGLSLDEVAGALAGSAADLAGLRDLLTAQLAALDARAAQIEDLSGQVRVLLDRLDDDALPSAEQFLSTLEPLRTLDVGAYLTRRQQAALTDRTGELGTKTVDDLKSEWLPWSPNSGGTTATRRRSTTTDQLLDEQVDRAAEKVWDERGTEISKELEQRTGSPGSGSGLSEIVAYVRSAREARP
jgi:MerR family transcriptional regulator, thiopeptide resistance regulator